MIDKQEIFSEYKAWILSHKITDGTITDEGDTVKISTPYAFGRVSFYDLDYFIVEMAVTNLSNDENKFYLHFELKDLNYAKELFEEMLATLLELKNHQKIKILLSCTGGLTTGFFADKLNEAAELLSLDYEFNAVPFHQLYEVAFDYSMVLLAPQIAYQIEKARSILEGKLVLKIPPRVFASYDSATMIDFIREELSNWNKTAEEKAIAKVRADIKSNAKILSIVVMPYEEQVRIAYRVYEKGLPILDETVIKGKLNVVRDLEDIIETVSRRCKFDAVGVAISGVVRGGYLDLSNYVDPEFNLNQFLHETSGVPVTITNNANAAVLGYYAQQDKYQNILFVTHPRKFLFGGAGIVVNGKMIQGKHNIAGEVKYVTTHAFSELESATERCYDPDVMLEIVSTEIRIGISVVDPELVCVRSAMTPDINIIKNKIMEVIPEEYLPDFVYLRDEEMAEYALLGQMILSLEALEGLSK